MRTILHCDCNGFYASVECLLKPELKKVPMAVCGNPRDRHGIILAKNELAKKYNIQTAETIWQAKQKCPDLVLVEPHHRLYSEYSKRINNIYLQYTDQVEPFGIDESWLDVTGSRRLFGSGTEIADTLRQRVKNEIGVTISVGVSFNKVFAKLGSDYKKPDATTEFSPENWKELVFPLPASDMLFVGKSTGKKLSEINIKTIGELASADPDFLSDHFGKMGRIMWIYANGLDDSPVTPPSPDDQVKSVGNGHTFDHDLTSPDEISFGVRCLSESVAARLRAKKLKCTAISVSVKDTDLKTVSRQCRLDTPTYISRELWAKALEIIRGFWPERKPIRAITVTAVNLIKEEDAVASLSLFEDVSAAEEKRKKLEKLESTMDIIKERYKDNEVFKKL